MSQPFAVMLEQLEHKRAALTALRTYLRGEQPAAYLSPKSREALDQRLKVLGVNYPALIVSSRTDRLAVTGFTIDTDDDGTPDGTSAQLWRRWRAAGLVALSDLVHADYLGLGAAYVTVWADQHGNPTATADNGLTVHVQRDPVTLEPIRSVRRWAAGGDSHAVMIDPERVTTWRAHGTDAPASPGAWKMTGEQPNPLGIVPVVPFIRRQSTDDTETGTSAVLPVLPLTDALAKVLSDALVGSEYYARPRRWATGLEIVEDDDGNPVDPFGEGRLLQSESPDTKFGQLEPSRATGYTELVAVLTQQIGALSGLPGHYTGLTGEQPPNADSLRAAEAPLVRLALGDQRQLDPAWARVASLLEYVADPDREPIPAGTIRTVWENPEARTPGQAADAAAKLHGIGLPLSRLLADPLGMDPETVAAVMRDARAEQVQRAGLDLSRILP